MPKPCRWPAPPTAPTRDRRVKRHLIGAAAVLLVVAACGEKGSAPMKPAPQSVAESAVETLLLTPTQLNGIMGTTTLVGAPVLRAMDDHKNLLPNLNCLGVWQIDESAIYGKNTYTAVRQQMLRTPDTDEWDALVAQSVVHYPTLDAARRFFDESAARWSKCVNHHVNITVNDRKLPKWLSGDLARTDTRLDMPITRGTGDQTRWCQHTLRLAANVIIDVEACAKQQPVTAAATIADTIADEVARS